MEHFFPARIRLVWSGLAVVAAAWLTIAGIARREGISVRLMIVRYLVKYRRSAFKDMDLLLSYRSRKNPEPASIPASVRKQCEISEREHHGKRVYTLTPKRNQSGWHILYMHGGGYINTLVGPHWVIIKALIAGTGATVTVPLYHLSPESDHVPGTRMAEEILESIMADTAYDKVAVAGDSAGGNFALNLVNRRHRNGQTLPDQLVLFAPWLDLSVQALRTSPEAKALEEKDTMLGMAGGVVAGKWWAGDVDPSPPELSPLFAEVDHLPPTAIFQGSRDILVLDAHKYASRLHEANSRHEYHETPGAFHVFVGAGPIVPEARRVFERVAELFRRK